MLTSFRGYRPRVDFKMFDHLDKVAGLRRCDPEDVINATPVMRSGRRLILMCVATDVDYRGYFVGKRACLIVQNQAFLGLGGRAAALGSSFASSMLAR